MPKRYAVASPILFIIAAASACSDSAPATSESALMADDHWR